MIKVKTVKDKMMMMAKGMAYISKCDGGYYFYYNKGTQYLKITKKTYDKLSYVHGVTFINGSYLNNKGV